MQCIRATTTRAGSLLPISVKARLKSFGKAVGRLVRHEYGVADWLYATGSSFSQFGEDVVLSQFLWNRRNGFYVDVGAFDPFVYSNTYLFYRRGWRGINLEPNPAGFARLVKHRPRDINLHLAVSGAEGDVRFTCDGVFSGIDDPTHLFRNHNPGARHIIVHARPLRSILEQYLPAGQEIDFLTVDCEGHDANVLASNDWTRFSPSFVLVEEHGTAALHEPETILIEQGYRPFCHLRLTKVFVRANARGG